MMKSRMDKYYDVNNTKARTAKNQSLYRTIYEEVEYSNVEGISVIEKNEKIDMDMIRELINKSNDMNKVKPVNYEKKVVKYSEEDFDDDKSYDIRDVLSKAKDSRTVDNKRISDTQYNILKGINLNDKVDVPEELKTEDLKDMIEAISANSKGYTMNLLDDLRSIYDPTMHEKIEQKIEETKEMPVSEEIDKSFYTNSMGFKDEDFEDLKQIKDDVKKNSILTKILIFVLLLVIVVGIVFLVFHFVK